VIKFCYGPQLTLKLSSVLLTSLFWYGWERGSYLGTAALVDFSWFWAATYISRLKWLQTDQDNLHIKFSALNADFSCPSPDSLCSTRPAHAGVEEEYPLKSDYCSDIGLSSFKMVADRHRYAAIITNTNDVIFSGMMILNDLEPPKRGF